MWVGELEAVLEILFEGSVFGKIDFVECNVIKRDILVEQGREGVDDISDAAPVDNRVDEGGADVFGKANCGSLYIDQLFEDRIDDLGDGAAGWHVDDRESDFVCSADGFIIQRVQIGTEFYKEGRSAGAIHLANQSCKIGDAGLDDITGGDQKFPFPNPLLRIGSINYRYGGNFAPKSLFSAQDTVVPQFFHIQNVANS